MLEHHESVQEIANQIGQKTHPAIGKISLVIMLASLAIGKITESDPSVMMLSKVSYILGGCSSIVVIGYYAWRWISEYSEKKASKAKQNKKHK